MMFTPETMGRREAIKDGIIDATKGDRGDLYDADGNELEGQIVSANLKTGFYLVRLRATAPLTFRRKGEADDGQT